MSSPVGLLVAVCRAVVPVFSGGGSAAGEVGAKVLSAVWDWWGAKTREAERRRELEAVARMTADQYRDAVRDVLASHAATESARLQAQLHGYLIAFQAQIRRASRRPSDPSGLTVSSRMMLARAEDLAPLLPPRPPRFAPGDKAPGTDLELVALLGIGGFGEVWKARNPFLPSEPPVALKFCLDPEAAASLRREARLLDVIRREGKHAGIVDLHRTYLSADPPFLEYEWVDGGDLGGFVLDRARRSGSVPPEDAARIVRRLADITGYAHAKGIVHRDLKPANVLTFNARRPDGKPEVRFKVTDFGIGGITAAVAVRSTARLGTMTSAAALGSYTAHYASPEQERGEPPDPRDDVHALGVIWYQMLVGDLTVSAPRGPGWKKRLAAKGIPAEHVELIEACVSSERADRPSSGEALAGHLRPPSVELVSAEVVLAEEVDDDRFDSPVAEAKSPADRSRRGPPPVPPALGDPAAWPRYKGLLFTLRSLRADRSRVVWGRSWGLWFFSTILAVWAFAGLSMAVGSLAEPRSYTPYGSYSYEKSYSSYSSPSTYTSYSDTRGTAAMMATFAVIAFAADRVRVFVRRRRNPGAIPPPSAGPLAYMAAVFFWFAVVCLLALSAEWRGENFRMYTMMLGICGLLAALVVARRVAAGRVRERAISTAAAAQSEFAGELAAVAPGIDLRNAAQLGAAIAADEEAYLVPRENPFARLWHRVFAPL